MRKIALLFVVISVIFGCAAKEKIVLKGNHISDVQVYHDENLTNGFTPVIIPALNAIVTSDIGSNMYQEGRKMEYDTYNLKIKSAGKINIPDVVDFSVVIDGMLYELYAWGPNKYKAFCIKDNHAQNVCLVDADNSGRFNYFAFGTLDYLYKTDVPIEYELQRTEGYLDDFYRVAIYQGISNGKIKISFREFKDVMARPAFTQDIEYELNKKGDTLIGFKGLRIKVIRADNMSITYQIIKGYD